MVVGMVLHLADEGEAISVWLIYVEDEQNGPLALEQENGFPQSFGYDAAKARFQQFDQLLLIERVGVGHKDCRQRCAHLFRSQTTQRLL